MKTEEQIKELAYKRYGTDHNSFGGQRDGFREGYRMCQESLQKTESDNNGWIKIESEENLPNGSYALYHVISKNLHHFNEPKNQGIEEFWGNDIEKKQYWLKEFTHYQPIVKPNLPLT